MLRESRRFSRGLKPLLLICLAISIAALAVTSTSTSQSTQAPTLRIVTEDGNSLPHILVTGSDVRNLQPGTHYIGTANGGVWKTTNGGNSIELRKIGLGTLVLPAASQMESRAGSGVLKNADSDAAGKGKLILDSVNDAVYEFRDLSSVDFDRVSISVSGETLTLNASGFMGRHRPASAMKRWPFKRLLIIPSNRIESIDGWTGRGSNAGFYCKSQFCQCSGQPDCLMLIKSGSCKSAMNCDGTGPGMTCFCDAKMMRKSP
jgi:hypothetical protein